jgi:Uma2 family endonuclease
MSTAPLIPNRMSVEEYLHTSFDGADREYLDGEVVERNMGNTAHSALQGELYFLLRNQTLTTGAFIALELRNRVRPTRFRIPDIAVYPCKPDVQIPTEPPLIAIEVLSPDDRPSYLMSKLEEYRQWRVHHIWIADPDAGKMFAYGDEGLREVTEFQVPRLGIVIRASGLFEI